MPKLHRRRAGFTLIELMITVAIVGILAAVVYPSYVDYVYETRRSDGKAALMDAAQQLQRCFTTSLDYTVCALDDPDGDGTIESPQGDYVITVVTTTATYDLTATPQAEQANDDCGNLTLDQAGTKGVGGSASLADCW